MKLKARKTPPPPTCRKKPVILLWTGWFGGDWAVSQGNVKCGNMQCEITSNHGRYKSSDALIFHGVSPQVRNPHYYPSKSSRPPKQLWVFRTMENPNIAERLGCKLSSFHNNRFHATMSYTRQADVRLCYGKVLKEPHDATNHNRNYAAGKTKFAAWVSSQCYPGRTSFVKDLSKYISIDKFGRCGNQRCAKDGSCMKRIGLQYKFYLSFENFICRDYVTEKYYRNAIDNNLIPIVVGGANYSDDGIVPPHSYINAQDFSTVEELANYLKKVAANDTLYNSYFKWKDSYKILSPCSATQSFCELCHKLCDDKWVTEKSKKTIPDLTYKWGVHRDNCVNYPDIFHKGSDGKITIHPRVY
ncbi:uncharacterized protein TRIADDRAFT_26518 [Trichoplax adhaerens]|uniref:Fucosyltransferase n=1 Tax=Trichoplax adhaerens TaxID=10228 RepID=B3RZT2_TRIAD|nr:hypothetical protein TRIADDRAFT_26518 [Trichoplax adhaerens]EDV23893.1 hypothetical protein TRIADDRAFT_26518 [Trichoplax adhaerens]|eukprot:XP_002113419.1 hypothetical protein TRIADDRAFT_26518 [Trichoplax adhaerens]